MMGFGVWVVIGPLRNNPSIDRASALREHGSVGSGLLLAELLCLGLDPDQSHKPSIDENRACLLVEPQG